MSDEFWGDSLATTEDYARVCYYSDPGVGKTSAAAGLAHIGRTLYYPFEPGFKNVALARLGVPTENLIPAKKLSSADIMEAFWRLKAKPELFTGVVFDTITNQVKSVKRELLKDEYRRGVAAAEARGEEYDKPKNWMPRERYGDLADEIGEIIQYFHTLPMHLAYTAHVREDTDPDSGDLVRSPAVTPAVNEYLMAYVDVLLRLRRVGTYDDGRPIIVGICEPGDGWKAKDRLGVLPRPSLVFPSMDRIVGYINGDLTEKNDKLQQEFVKWKSDLKKARIVKKVEE